MPEAMRRVPDAFDRFAATYDADFSSRAPARLLRQAVWDRLRPLLKTGMRVLDLGCGTGEDALWLARAGCRVTAVDASPAMLTETARKAARDGARVETQCLDINARQDFGRGYHMVLSNFGALNCVVDLAPLGAALRAAVVPGGIVAFNAMGRFCAWETIWQGLHLRRSAVRRWRGRARADIGGRAIDIRYWRVRDIAAALGPIFRVESVTAVGAFLPPSDLFPLLERRPRLLRRLAHWEARWAAHALAAPLADHRLVILRRAGREEDA